MAASKRKQVVQDLEAATVELAAATHELQSKQLAVGSLTEKLADSERELVALKQSVHALHAEQATAQHTHAQAQTQLAEAQAQLDGALLQLSSQKEQHQDDGKGGDCSPVENACMLTQTDTQTSIQEEGTVIAVARRDREEQGTAISRSFADGQDCTPQVSLHLLLSCRGCSHILGFTNPSGHQLRVCCISSVPCLLQVCILHLTNSMQACKKSHSGPLHPPNSPVALMLSAVI